MCEYTQDPKRMCVSGLTRKLYKRLKETFMKYTKRPIFAHKRDACIYIHTQGTHAKRMCVSRERVQRLRW